MFLTKFDKKMYEEAIRQEGREEIAEKYEELTKDHEELEKSYEEMSQKQQRDSIECAKSLRDNGVSYEIVRASMPMLDVHTLNKIFGKID